MARKDSSLGRGGPGFSRRSFLIGATAAGGVFAVGAWELLKRLDRGKDVVTDPTVFLRIESDDTVTLWCKHLEMGQGIMTGLATIVAEEMDADWSRFRVEPAPGNREHFKNNYYGRQVTAASTSIANSWTQMRHVGAAARAMMVAAAAARWQVPAEEIDVTEGLVRHGGTGQEATFGELAVAAMGQPVPDPEELALKPPGKWKLIGTSLTRVESAPKIAGEATYALDIRRPGMVRAMVARPPRFGATVASFDATEALEVPGVLEVVEIPTGVAVLAEDTWAAARGREALSVVWDDTGAETRSTAEIYEEYRALADRPGVVALDRGNAARGLAAAVHKLDFEFRAPYLAHAPMEPLDCVMERTELGAEIWSGCQLPTLEQLTAAEILGLDPGQVKVNSLLAGASFGRRANPMTDWIRELAPIVRASRLQRPVQLVCTREDDIKGGVYRPMALHRVEAGIDDAGAVTGWRQTVVCKSLVLGTPWSYARAREGVDRASVGGIVETCYSIPNLHVEVHNPKSPVTVGFWRSVGDSQNAWVLETVMDELAHAAGRDPLEFRLSHLQGAPRQRAVLELAAEKAGWGASMAEGRGRGVAGLFDGIYGLRTYVGMVTDVTAHDGGLQVDRIVCAVDCGVAINPDIVVGQVEGSISFALSTTLRNEITLNGGIVEQSNFHDFEPTRLSDMPEIEVHIIGTDNPPSGVGEAAVAPVSPSIGNALFAATGRRLRSLPLNL